MSQFQTGRKINIFLKRAIFLDEGIKERDGNVITGMIRIETIGRKTVVNSLYFSLNIPISGTK